MKMPLEKMTIAAARIMPRQNRVERTKSNGPRDEYLDR